MMITALPVSIEGSLGFWGDMSDTKTGVQKVQDECATCWYAKN